MLGASLALGSVPAFASGDEQNPPPKPPRPNVFQMPAHAVAQNAKTVEARNLFIAGRTAEAEALLHTAITEAPHWPAHHYNLAILFAQKGAAPDAISALKKAFDLGFRNRDALDRDQALNPLRSNPDFVALQNEIRRQTRPSGTSLRLSDVKDGIATVDEANTIWEPNENILLSGFSFDEENRPIAGSVPIEVSEDPVGTVLNDWFDKGRAAGNFGDLYDNRDGSHSPLSKALFPQLTHTTYTKTARRAGHHYGAASRLFFNRVTFGNSSTALTGSDLWRSQARFLLTSPGLAKRLYQQYANNHIYIYPEHRDHDNELGDLFPANTPYMFVSQGSSTSDRWLMSSTARILAAFQPEVKEFLVKERLIAPTVQMIVRNAHEGVRITKDYLTGRAHPSVFWGPKLDQKRMIEIANAIERDAIPPQAVLSVIEEPQLVPGLTYLGPDMVSEKLFDTPSAIARIARSTNKSRKIVVSAERTRDPNGRELTFHWRILRGDPRQITIEPLNESESRVAIDIGWHKSRPVPGKDHISTNRVDIALFAHNGVHYSAPAFISYYFPPHENRIYSEDGRLLEIDYSADQGTNPYIDPLLFRKRGWRDTYRYTSQGELIGWERTHSSERETYTRHGALVRETDAQGRALRAEIVRYTEAATGPLFRRINVVPTGDFLAYRYTGPGDALGTVRRCSDPQCLR
ncbi:MAG: hypothetical protein AAGE61_06365 [Pseudomonadota bacterium]